MKETTLRTTLRGIGWRIIVSLITAITSYILIGSFLIAISIVGAEFIIKLFGFVLFEKLFAKHVSYGIKNNKESIKRTLLKGFFWRIVATLMTVTITFVITGNLETTGAMALIDFPLKLTLYTIYEQLLWGKIKWGKILTCTCKKNNCKICIA